MKNTETIKEFVDRAEQLSRRDGEALFKKHKGSDFAIVQTPVNNFVVVHISEASWTPPEPSEEHLTMRVGKTVCFFKVIGNPF